MDAPAAHKKASEGSFAVCSSMARATGPSLCSMGFVIQALRKRIPIWIHLIRGDASTRSEQPQRCAKAVSRQKLHPDDGLRWSTIWCRHESQRSICK
jgi:hypothetical protein